jgi:hypothetical protein
MPEFAAVRRAPHADRHTAFSRDLAGRFPVQFLIFLLSQKLAGAAFHGLSGRRSQPGRAIRAVHVALCRSWLPLS